MQKNKTQMQTIKIKTTDKGEHHWEKYLLHKQQVRLNHYLKPLNINPWDKRRINNLFKARCTKDNIIPLNMHPIKIFVLALIRNELNTLLDNVTKIKS